MTVTNTPSSSIGRTSLASPGDATPSGGPEMAIARIFSEVFSLNHVGVDEEFFELGGDSLLVVVMSVRVSEWTGMDIPAFFLTEHGSPRQIANLLTTIPAVSIVD